MEAVAEAGGGEIFKERINTAAVTFADKAVIGLTLDGQYLGADHAEQTAQRLRSFEYVGGQGKFTDSNIHAGLETIRTEILGGEALAKDDNILVVLTDGNARSSDDKALPSLVAELAAHSDDVYDQLSRWAFGVGCSASDAVLSLLAGRDGNVGIVDSAGKSQAALVRSILDTIADGACPPGACHAVPDDDACGASLFSWQCNGNSTLSKFVRKTCNAM